uniref:L1 transposable element RRM domain-containing protein n=1 Tax=Xenopus tropicalis TaxID=8364 RepID=A0A6I8R1R5_XENTR
MGKPNKSRSEREKTPNKKQSAAQSDIAPLFLKRKTDRLESKMAPVREMREEEADSNRELSEQESDTEEGIDLQAYISNLPSKADIKDMLREMTDTIKEEIQDIKKDMLTLAARTDDLENGISKCTSNQKTIYMHIQQQDSIIHDLQRQLEDQENRSRRSNIRVRGVPERIPNEEIRTVLLQIFNKILNRDPAAEIKIERAHRVQKPKIHLYSRAGLRHPGTLRGIETISNTSIQPCFPKNMVQVTIAAAKPTQQRGFTPVRLLWQITLTLPLFPSCIKSCNALVPYLTPSPVLQANNKYNKKQHITLNQQVKSLPRNG